MTLPTFNYVNARSSGDTSLVGLYVGTVRLSVSHVNQTGELLSPMIHIHGVPGFYGFLVK